jgi:membrane associated rhomboid family serine protease
VFLPIGDDNTRRKSFPIVTVSLVAINVVMFILELQGGEEFVYNHAVIPVDFTEGSFPILNVFTAMFMHGGWAHLLGNMLYLYVFGDNVEDNMGRGRFLLFYLLAGVIATFTQIYMNPGSHVANLGASGAISGVLASYMILYPRNRVRVLMVMFVWNVAAWVVLGMWIGTQLLAGYTSIFQHQGSEEGGIAYMAHIGGFIAGLILVFLFRRKQQTGFIMRPR